MRTKIAIVGRCYALAILTCGVLHAEERSAPAKALGKPGSVVEAESLVGHAKASAGPVSVQDMQGFGSQWSAGSQLFWRPPAPVEKPIKMYPFLTFGLQVPVGGLYHVAIYHTVAPDYGNFRVFIRGKPEGDFAGYGGTVGLHAANLGSAFLNAGYNQVYIVVFGKEAASTNYFVGIDRIVVQSEKETATTLPPPSEVTMQAIQPAPPPGVGALSSAPVFLMRQVAEEATVQALADARPSVSRPAGGTEEAAKQFEQIYLLPIDKTQITGPVKLSVDNMSEGADRYLEIVQPEYVAPDAAKLRAMISIPAYVQVHIRPFKANAPHLMLISCENAYEGPLPLVVEGGGVKHEVQVGKGALIGIVVIPPDETPMTIRIRAKNDWTWWFYSVEVSMLNQQE